MASAENRSTPGPALGRCPICGKDAQPATRPFCSKRCADVDLARWLGGSYVIAGGSGDADEDGDDAVAGAAPPASAGDDLEPED